MSANIEATAAFLDYVERYMDAASHIPEGGNRLQPIIQTYGLTTELSLKAFLAATSGEWPLIHDLMELADLGVSNGLVLNATDYEDYLENLNSRYFVSKDGFWRYPSRYPKTGGSVWVTPTVTNMRRIITEIAHQAGGRIGRTVRI